MFNRQLKRNLKELDVMIGKQYAKLNVAKTNDERNAILEEAKKLGEQRDKLSESKTRGSLAPVLITSLIGAGVTFMAIRHEDTNVITGKAIGFAQKMFRG